MRPGFPNEPCLSFTNIELGYGLRTILNSFDDGNLAGDLLCSHGGLVTNPAITLVEGRHSHGVVVAVLVSQSLQLHQVKGGEWTDQDIGEVGGFQAGLR